MDEESFDSAMSEARVGSGCESHHFPQSRKIRRMLATVDQAARVKALAIVAEKKRKWREEAKEENRAQAKAKQPTRSRGVVGSKEGDDNANEATDDPTAVAEWWVSFLEGNDNKPEEEDEHSEASCPPIDSESPPVSFEDSQSITFESEETEGESLGAAAIADEEADYGDDAAVADQADTAPADDDLTAVAEQLKEKKAKDSKAERRKKAKTKAKEAKVKIEGVMPQSRIVPEHLALCGQRTCTCCDQCGYGPRWDDY